jgi:hypothetical protein
LKRESRDLYEKGWRSLDVVGEEGVGDEGKEGFDNILQACQWDDSNETPSVGFIVFYREYE